MRFPLSEGGCIFGQVKLQEQFFPLNCLIIILIIGAISLIFLFGGLKGLS